MDADFFHPSWEGGRRGMANRQHCMSDIWSPMVDINRSGGGGGTDLGGLIPSVTPRGGGAVANVGDDEDEDHDIGETLDGGSLPLAQQAGAASGAAANQGNSSTGDSNSNYRAAVRAFVSWTLTNPANRGPLLSNDNSSPAWNGPNTAATSPASDVHLEIYSSRSANLKSDDEGDKAVSESVSRMHAHGKNFQAKLDSLLQPPPSNGLILELDMTAFQECLLDYWDEVFPATAGVHFYNRESPVPRMSRLHSFLTTPCPKAIGMVQCEIERVKVSSKSKGAKGMT